MAQTQAVVVEQTPAEKQREELIAKLAEIGGKGTTEEDIVFGGTKVQLPGNMNLKDAIGFLQNKLDEDEHEMHFTRTFQFRPWDGARASSRAFKRAFGMLAQKSIMTMFGPKPPSLITINTDVGEQEQVPWGRIELPHLPGLSIYLDSAYDQEMGPLFKVDAVGPRRYRFHAEGLFRLIEDELKQDSMYRGKAFDGQQEPQFLDLRGIDPNKVVYSEEVTAQLHANVWSLMEYSDKMRSQGMPLKRAVLFEGPYGTGKTLGAYLTAKIAKENGWTFIMCRPGKDNLHEVMATARLYQPSVVFFEDVDTVSAGGDQDQVSKLLDTFDGIAAKGTEIMVVLTTNHKDRIHKGMMRPGRLDAVISIGALDQSGVQKMAEVVTPAGHLAEDIDWVKVHESMEGFMPAFVKEAIDRSLRYSMARNEGEIGTIDTLDLCHSAEGLRPQLDLMNGAKEGTTPDPLGIGMKKLVSEVLDTAKFVNSDGENTTGDYATGIQVEVPRHRR